MFNGVKAMYLRVYTEALRGAPLNEQVLKMTVEATASKAVGDFFTEMMEGGNVAELSEWAVCETEEDLKKCFFTESDAEYDEHIETIVKESRVSFKNAVITAMTAAQQKKTGCS